MRTLLRCDFSSRRCQYIDVRVAQSRKKDQSCWGGRVRKRKKAVNPQVKNLEKVILRLAHYLEFLKGILNQLDTFPEMKGFYLIMDNAPPHPYSRRD
ncbi:hypothetical protein BD770DRAFT_201587 [Pilaira anomala]|nr:hypothetical protein BD770DRAFT_201587 [Pilaira anomala]